MDFYTSPEVVELGVASEVILWAKSGPLWDEVEQNFMHTESTVIDVDA